ncbi:MAG: UPF0182 family protein [Deltaproteobacteria bacterium]|nr:UPF0182 family protein [Deltaproteobacteria bacterium]
MSRWKRRALMAALALLVLGALYLISNLIFVNFIVDYWWFDSLGFSGYFWLREMYRYVVFFAATTFFFLVFFLNFWFAARFLGSTGGAAKADPKQEKIQQGLSRVFLSGSMKVLAPLSLILAVLIAVPLYNRWEETLLFLAGSNSDLKDVVFAKEVTYFLFNYPIYTLIQTRLLIAALTVLAALASLYWIQKGVFAQKGQPFPRAAKAHLSILVLALFVIQAWGFVLKAHSLVYSNAHEPLFYGPGYTEINIILYLTIGAIFLLLATALSLIVLIHTKKGYVLLSISTTLFAVCLLLVNTTFLPDIIDKYVVKPNEIEREKPYIKNSIQATLEGYGLDYAVNRSYPLDKGYRLATDQSFQMNIQNIPVWDQEFLKEVYFQLQGLRTYYNFADVDVDRYNLGGNYQQVYLAAREVNLSKMPAIARNWQNEHMTYTHGQGAVMTPAVQSGDQGISWALKDVPPISPFGLAPGESDLYYGTDKYPYILVPNDVRETDVISGKSDYTGKGGVPMGNIWRKFLFAVYFKDSKIFTTFQTNDESRILFRRNIVECVKEIAPFLKQDSDPYLVVAKDRLYWVVDCFTTSSHYPGSSPVLDGSFNYIRASVRATIDAFDGTVKFYITDPKDPIAKAYDAIYPGLFSGKTADIPRDIREHLRYPKDLFVIQMEKYLKYHQKDPVVFFQQRELMQFAKSYEGKKAVSMAPYYITVDLIKPGRQEFLLVLPLSPINRDNLAALAVGRCDGEKLGDVMVYDFPAGEQVYGPSQVNTVIDQDTDISKEFTLWNQAGSEVKRGRMIVLPIAKKMLYVQPVYLRARTASRFPELKRVIVSQGDTAVMDVSVEKALEALEAKLERRETEKARLDKSARAAGETAKAKAAAKPLTASPAPAGITPVARPVPTASPAPTLSKKL